MKNILILCALIAVTFGAQCVLYNGHHLHTVGGFVNDTALLQKLGDYNFASNPNFQVQIRNTWCEPHTSSYYRPCTTGLAFYQSTSTSANQSAFLYDSVKDILTQAAPDGTRVITQMGTILEISSTVRCNVRRRTTGGYTIQISYNGNPLTPADTNTLVWAIFTPTSTVVTIETNLLGSLSSGICIDPSSTLVNPPMTVAPIVSATGSIFEQLSRSVRSGIFPRHVNPPPYINTSQAAPGAIAYCSTLNLGTQYSWLFNCCISDVTNFGATTIKEAQRLICGIQCPSTSLSTTLAQFVKDPTICNTVCDMQAVNLRTNFPEGFNLHATNWTGADLPGVVPTFTNSRDVANFIAPAGGDYTFQIKAIDCGDSTSHCCGCSGPAKNVTITVGCQQKFWINAGQDFSVNYDDYLYPEIFMSGTLYGADQVTNSIHLSWEFVTGPYIKYGTSAPTIYNPVSLSPSWIPYVAGTYILEVVAFDGCLFVKSRVTVNVVCYDTQHAPYYSTNAAPTLDGFSTNEMVWADTTFMNIRFATSEANPFNSVNPSTFSPKPKSLTPATALSSPYLWDINTVGLNSGTWYMRVYYHNVISTGTYTRTTNTSCTINLYSDKGYEYTREEASTIINNNCIQYTTESGTETIYDEYNKIQCSYVFSSGIFTATPSSGTNFARISDLAQFENNTAWYSSLYSIVHQNDPFEFPVCTGTYNFALEYKENRAICKALNDTVPVDVKCRAVWSKPVARTLAPCFEVYFNYLSGSFQSVTLTGQDSKYYDSSATNIVWTLLLVPKSNNWTTSNPNPFPVYGNTATFKPSMAGVYRVKLSATDNCAVDSETIDVTAVCPATLTGALNSTQGSSIAYSYVAPVTVVLNAGASVCSDNTATKYYKFTTTQPGGITSITNWQAAPTFGFVPNREGTWTVVASITDQCKLVNQTYSTTLTCTNTLVSSLTASTTAVVVAQYNPFSPQIPTWPTLTLTDSSTIAAGNFQYRNLNITRNGAYVSTIPLSVVSGTYTYYYNPTGAGVYNFRSNAIDSCNKYPITSLVTVTTACWPNAINVLYDYATGFSSTMYWEDLYPTSGAVPIVLWANRTTESNATYLLSYSWNSSAFPISSLTYINGGLGVSIAGAKVGTWSIQLNVFDGCNTIFTTISFTIQCRNTVTASAASPTPTVSWTNDKFPLVSVNGKASSIGTLVGGSQVTGKWIFLHAPQNSIFKGRDDRWPQTVVIYNTTTNSNTLLTGKSYRYSMKNYTSITTAQIVNRGMSTLVYTSGDENFASCFRPDLPGAYTLQLSLTGPCTVSNSTVVVTANCLAAPTISYSITGESSATPVVNKRIIFDASATTIVNTAATRFYWTLSDCAGNDLTAKVLNSASSVASWTTTIPGYYCVRINVTDLCATSFVDQKFYVNCSMKYATPTIGTTYATIVPLSIQEVSIPMTDATTKRGTYNDPFIWSYKWTLAKYTPPQTPAYSGVMTILPTMALNILALLAAMLFFF